MCPERREAVGMILYHGSFLEISQPDLVHSRPNLDFGRGFYVTPLYEQAVKWCGKFKRRGKDGIISKYEYGIYIWHLLMINALCNNSEIIMQYIDFGEKIYINYYA